MKKLIFLIIFIPAVTLAETIQTDIPDEWRPTIEDSVISLDEWIFIAIREKHAPCQQRVITKEIQQSLDLGEQIPAGRQAIVDKHLNRPGYKKRKDRKKDKDK